MVKQSFFDTQKHHSEVWVENSYLVAESTTLAGRLNSDLFIIFLGGELGGLELKGTFKSASKAKAGLINTHKRQNGTVSSFPLIVLRMVPNFQAVGLSC